MANKKRYQCAICAQFEISRPRLYDHLIIHKFGSSYRCAVCAKDIANRDKLRQHLICHTVKPFQCRDCPRRFRTKYELQTHTGWRRFGFTRRFSCCHCLAKFNNKVDLAAHVVAHFGQRKFGCPFCSVSYETRNSLSSHVRIQHANGIRRPFRCSSCQLAFTSLSERTAHHAATHAHGYSQPNRGRFRCAVCGSGYAYLQRLRSHLAAHYNGPAHRCAVCGQARQHKADLAVHIKAVHLKEKRFLCDRCPAGFALKRSLAGHIRAHSRPNTVHCTDCGKPLRSDRRLAIHKRVHHAKPEALKYGCSQCGRHFLRKSLLHRHCVGHAQH